MVVGMYYRFGLGIFMMLVEGQQVYDIAPGGRVGRMGQRMQSITGTLE